MSMARDGCLLEAVRKVTGPRACGVVARVALFVWAWGVVDVHVKEAETTSREGAVGQETVRRIVRFWGARPRGPPESE